MFSFLGGLSQRQQNAKPANLFSENDIREILSSFHLDDSEYAQKLLLSSSKGDLIRRDELVSAIKRDVEQGEGNILLRSICERYRVDDDVLITLLNDQGWVYMTADNRSILTRQAQDALLSRTQQKASTLFQPTISLTSNEVSPKTLMQLLASRDSDPSVASLVIASPASPTYFKSAGIEVYSSSLLQNVKQDITDSVTKSKNNASPVSWGLSEFHGLSAEQFHHLVSDMLTDSEFSNAGQLAQEKDRVVFAPSESLSKERNARLDHLIEGNVPYMALDDLVGSQPTQFSTKEEVEAAIRRQDWRAPVQFSGSSAISLSWIEVKLKTIISGCGEKGHATLSSLITSFPVDTRNSVSSFIESQLNTHRDLSKADDFVISETWIRSLEMKATGVSTTLAQAVWDREDQTRPKPSAVETQVKEEICRAEAVESTLIDSVWITKDRLLAKTALSAYNNKLEELDAHCDTQFNAMWRSRVMSKIHLYSHGLAEIPDQGLRDQLRDLLQMHITSELVPSAANRAKSKGLLKSPRHKLASRLPKLQSSLPGKKDLSAVVDELGKFGGQIELSALDDEQLQEEKAVYIKEMVKTMQKDDDNARLFLCFLIVLLGTKHQGIIYATGKFAPKMLKMLKPELSSQDGQWLDSVKDSVKTGTTTEEMKSKMRSMAANLAEVTKPR